MPQGFLILEAEPGSDAVAPVDFLVSYANSHFLAMVMKRPEEVVGYDFSRVFPGVQAFHMELLLYVFSSWDTTAFDEEDLIPGKILRITLYRPSDRQIACLIEDISSSRAAENQLRRQKEMEKEMSRIATRLIACSAGDVDRIVTDSLRRIGRFYHASQCLLLSVNQEAGHASVTHEGCASDVTPRLPEVQGLALSELPWWFDQLREEGQVHIPDPFSLPDVAIRERLYLLESGINAQAAVALFEGERLTGALCLEYRTGPVDFSPSDLAMLHALAASISNALVRLKMERTLLQRQEQLLQSQKLESIGRLAGGVAHDFNNMLSVILGYADALVERMPAEDPNLADVREIQRAASRSRGLASQLLAFARKQASEPRVLDLNALIQDSVSLMRKLVGENVEVRVELDPALPPALIDATQFHQILLNLAANARDAMPQGGVIRVSTSRVTLSDSPSAIEGLPAGEYARVRFSDSGNGIPPEVVDHVFEPFFTTKEKGHGTGLGLPTVYGIVHQHHGAIRVRSRPGAGTVFIIDLPRARGPVTASTSGVPPVRDVRGHETVLYVEDEEALLRLGTSVLKRAGYTVLDADCGETALVKAARADAIDLLITDVIMPGMNGRELCETLRRDRPGLPCLFMSGYTSDIIDHEGILDADIHFLQKPFRASLLLTKVRLVLDGAAGKIP